MFRTESIDHVEVFVSDLAAAAKWYGDVFGLKEILRWNPEPIMIGPGSQDGGSKLALFQANAARTDRKEEAHWHRVAWKTDAEGFKAAQEHLRSLGIAFEGPIDHRLSESIYFSDLDGNPLEITFYKR